jgi:chemotaxis protein MotB
VRPERRIRVPEPPPLEDDQTGWLMTFSDLVLQLFAFALVATVLTGAVHGPAPAAPVSPLAEAASIRPVLVPVPSAPPAPSPAAEPTPVVEPAPASPPAHAAAEPDDGLTSAAERLRAAIETDGVRVSVADANLVVTFSDTVTFGSGHADLLADAAPILRRLGALARAMPDFDLEIAGHTDDVPIHSGEFPSNLELSLARAARVTRELTVEAPELASRAVAVGYGEHRPVASNGDDEGRARNRRVEIRFRRRGAPS